MSRGKGGARKILPSGMLHGMGYGGRLSNSLRVSVWGGALRFSSVLVGTHCQAPWAHFVFLLRVCVCVAGGTLGSAVLTRISYIVVGKSVEQ